jgi:hypothetical protein
MTEQHELAACPKALADAIFTAEKHGMDLLLGLDRVAEYAAALRTQPQAGEVEQAEAKAVSDIAAMMSEFVDNWPKHTKLSTSLALIAKTMRAALDENEDDALERAIDRMGWAEINAFNERAYQDVYEDAGGFLLRKIKRLFGIRRDPVLTYQDAARAMVEEARRSAIQSLQPDIQSGGGRDE